MDHVLRAIRGGKHVLCEKPFAASAEEVAIMYAAADKAGVLLQVLQPGNQLAPRWHPQGGTRVLSVCSALKPAAFRQEGMWTRFFPATEHARTALAEGPPALPPAGLTSPRGIPLVEYNAERATVAGCCLQERSASSRRCIPPSRTGATRYRQPRW